MINGKAKAFQKKQYNILLVDDHLGNYTSANFLQYKLNESFVNSPDNIKALYGAINIALKITPEKHLCSLKHQLMSEPFDLILLDLNFKYDTEYRDDYDFFIKKSAAKFDTTLETVKGELGAFWLQEQIRPFHPTIPVIIFTSKYQDSIEMASKYGLYGFHADYFEKARLLWNKNDRTDQERQERLDIAFSSLLTKILDGIRRFENDYVDRIEVSETREEALLAAKSRDYMQSRLWGMLAEAYHKNDTVKIQFAVAFFDFDGMKAVNEKLGYTETNKVIKAFSKEIDDFLEQRWKVVVPAKYHNETFYRPILGRFFRERGDEFMILFPIIIGKESSEGSAEKGIIEFLDDLILQINLPSWQSAIFGNNTTGLKLTSSFGLFVFPDDLTMKSQRLLSCLKNERLLPDESKLFVKQMSFIYSEISRIPQLLKDSAKLLGKNQVCYFMKDLVKTVKDEKLISGSRIKVAILDPGKKIGDENEFIKFLWHLTDELAYDFELISGVDSITDKYHMLLFVYGDTGDSILTQILNYNRIKRKLISLIVWFADGKNKEQMENDFKDNEIDRNCIYSGITNVNNFRVSNEWILTPSNKNMHDRLITNMSHLGDARKCFYDAVTALANENKYDEYIPRYAVQKLIYDKFEDLKKELVMLDHSKPCDECDDGHDDSKQLREYSKGFTVKSPRFVWAIKRISNKGGQDKYNIIVTIDVDEVAYKFLNMESGRNMVKLQQYFDGFLKGLMVSKPDKEYIKQLVPFKYDLNSEGNRDLYHRYRSGDTPSIVCRNPFYSPVSPNVYYEIVDPSRVRIDISFIEKQDTI